MFKRNEFRFVYKDGKTDVQMYHQVKLSSDAIKRITNVILEETEKAALAQVAITRVSTLRAFPDQVDNNPLIEPLKEAVLEELPVPVGKPLPLKTFSAIQSNLSEKEIKQKESEMFKAAVAEDDFGRAFALNDLPDTAFLINECHRCQKKLFTKKGTLREECDCGEPISRTKKEWYRLNYGCPNCNKSGFGFATANLTEVNCKECGSPIDIELRKNNMVGGILLGRK